MRSIYLTVEYSAGEYRSNFLFRFHVGSLGKIYSEGNKHNLKRNSTSLES